MGAAAHPSPSVNEREEVDRKVLVAKAVARLAAHVLPQWPRLSLEGAPLREAPKVPQGP